MELKHGRGKPFFLQYACFNRTFMELKLDPDKARSWVLAGFNRTFMELKHGSADASHAAAGLVLIGPSWN